jgi:hypothetical protein
VLMTPSADTELLLARSYGDTETTPLHIHEAGDGTVPESSEQVAGISDNPSYELEDLPTGFARVPTNILDVASGLCIHESARLLPDHSASDLGPHDSSSDCPRYANVEHFSKFIPACNPHSKVARTCRVVMSRRKVMLSMQSSQRRIGCMGYESTPDDRHGWKPLHRRLRSYKEHQHRPPFPAERLLQSVLRCCELLYAGRGRTNGRRSTKCTCVWPIF